ncbi:carboxypeptidase N subunit 2-like [Mercenaria mercenaria]|uniref:carboxypeptidase N subunit 2-like n=1 Tax=Mercenaria mercenaria TaxID=6596 RepID=UPI00234E43F5|nr:carboxypeptidase N subunit 2-like [Mercenaria mercenaria]
MLSVNLNTINIFLLGLCCAFESRVNTCISPTTSCDCFKENFRIIINCRYKNLTEIPTFVDTRQVYDEIRFTSFEETGTCQPTAGCNNITRIDANAFANLKVRTIDLRNNPVAHVDVAAFSALVPILESLLLEGDGANAIPYQALAALDIHLKGLHLQNYGSVVLQSPVVFPFPNLESFTLKNWRNLDSITPSVFNIMQNLKKFRLFNMPSLVSLPVPAIHKFLKLTTLEVMDTGIRSIFGDTYFPLSVLYEIKISDNVHLTSIDKRAFNGVTDTALYLDVSNNNLDNIEFLLNGHWTALRRLNIGYNYNLRGLPTGIFGNIPALRYLDCQNIGLTQIDKTMFIGLSSLHTLDLAYNQITHISTGAFQNSPSLVELRMNDQQTHNQLMKFQNNSFLGVESSVEILNLMGNRLDLTQFWEDLTRLGNLKELDITHTAIRIIPDNAFRGNTLLNTLLLSDNNITSLKQETFYGPRHTLRTIDLRGNGIRYIDICVLNDFPIKPTMILFGNPLVCDCELVWLYDWFNTQSNQARLAGDIGMCAFPPSLLNKFFHEFTRNALCPGPQSTKTCPAIYVTDISSTTTTTTTTATTTTTKSPLPLFEFVIVNVDQTSIEVTWNITDKTFVTELKLEIKSNGNTRIIYLGIDQSSYIFYQLTVNKIYTICLILKINGEFRDEGAYCKHVRTLQFNAAKPTPHNPDSVLG